MATTAQRDQVIKAVGLFPVAFKSPEWNDVMHVKTATKFNLGYPTMLAGVFIALACLVALAMPVLAAHIAAGSIPFRFINGDAVIVVALLGTVEIAITSVLGLVSFGRLTAISAGEFDKRFRLAQGAAISRFVVALRRTVTLAVSALYVWVWLATLFAGSCFRRGAAMGHALRVGNGTRIRTIFTWWMRGVVMLYSRLRGVESLFTSLTNQCDWHQKILPTKDGRHVFTGWGRPAVGSRLFGTVHEAVPSPCGIIPQPG